MIEGMIIAGWTIKSTKGYIFIRGEYRYLIEIVDKAIEEAYRKVSSARTFWAAAGILISTRTPGAGAYECGEESASARIAGRQARHSAFETAVSRRSGRVSMSHHFEQLRNILHRCR